MVEHVIKHGGDRERAAESESERQHAHVLDAGMAISRLMPCCFTMKSAATNSENAPNATSTVRGSSEELAASVIVRNRAMPSIAVFKSAPESMADTGAGPSLCASGSHVCIGARPAFVP